MKRKISFNLHLLSFIFYLLTFISVSAAPASAQTSKPVHIAADETYTDHLTLGADSRDTDLMLKLRFDEQDNSLTVSLISYRRLFVFQDDTRYSQVVRHKRLRPDHFPYVVNAADNQRFKLSKQLRKSISHPHRKHIFRRWLTYEGLIPQPAEFSMVNDFIEQKFDVKNKLTNVAVTLHDVFLLEPDARKSNIFYLLCGKDFNIRYDITIHRNPCFGLDTEIQTAQTSLDELQKNYKTISSKYASRKVASQDALKLFGKMQATILQQFPPHTDAYPCPDLQERWNHYNLLRDSLAQMTCTVEVPDTASGDFTVAALAAGGIDHVNISSRARQIDDLVARYLISNDETERRDVKLQCQQIIKETNAIIKAKPAHSAEQQRAVKLFRDAQRYYETTISR